MGWLKATEIVTNGRLIDRSLPKWLPSTHVVVVFLDDGLVEADGLFILVLLHEEHVGHVKIPCVVLVAELHRFTEDLLHHVVVLPVPVDLGLSHEDWDIPADVHINIFSMYREPGKKLSRQNKSAMLM